MGCFGGGKQKSIEVPPPPKLPTAEELFAAGTKQAQATSPLAYGARESALADIARGPDFYNEFRLGGSPYGEINPNYFEQFGPTSLEEALADQYFMNVMPRAEKNISHYLSLSGMANSPILARLIGEQTGQTGFDIGSFLSNRAQERAVLGLQRQDQLQSIGENRAINSLNYRNIDPFSMITPYVQTGMNQGNAQADIDWQYAQAKAQADYQNAVQKQQSQGMFGSSIGSILGGVGGFMVGGPAGAGLGASLGGSTGNIFAGGGGQTPLGMGDALSLYSAFTPGNAGFLHGYGRNTPKNVYNTGSMSVFGRG